MKLNQSQVIKNQKNFIKVLQLEYFTHKLRSIIYENEIYKKVAYDIALKKKDKIIFLGDKFGLDTIFSNKDNFDYFLNNEFLSEKGLPNFQYHSAEQQRVQGNFDKWFLFSRGKNVIYLQEEVTVISNNPKINELKVKLKISSEEICVKYKDVKIKNDFKWN